MVATWKEVGVNYGGQHIGKGISRALRELDRLLGKETAAIFERPSIWITIIGAFGLPAAAVYAKLKDPWDKLAILTGGFLSTGFWDVIEEVVAGGGGAGAAYTPTAYAPSTPTSTPVTSGGKYTTS